MTTVPQSRSELPLAPSRAAPVERIGVAVPARNEASGLERCLCSLAAAAAAAPVPVVVSVVADACSDDTAGIATAVGRRLGLDLVVNAIQASAVGHARRAGMDVLLGRLGVAGTWLATTDADSEVPVHWFARQLTHADAGASLVAGTVWVADWSAWPPAVRARAEQAYEAPGRRHVHGANLSFRADAYQSAGGFTRRTCDEDVALVASFLAQGEPVAWADDLAVRTSARRVGRAPRGFAGFLASLTPAPVAP